MECHQFIILSQMYLEYLWEFIIICNFNTSDKKTYNYFQNKKNN